MNCAKTLLLSAVYFSLQLSSPFANAVDNPKAAPHGGVWLTDESTRAELVLRPAPQGIDVYLEAASAAYPPAIALSYTDANGKQVALRLTAMELTPQSARYHAEGRATADSYVGAEVHISLGKSETHRLRASK